MAWSAPSATQAAHFSSLPAVANTVAPRALAIWIAVTPMPLVPPCTSRVSPGCSRARSNTLLQTVKKVSGRLAASTSLRPCGHRQALGAGATQYSAYPPPATSAHTRSPSLKPAAPVAAASPATTAGDLQARHIGGARRHRVMPMRCSTSGRLTPAAAHADQHFAGARHRHRALGQAQHLGRAVAR